MRRLLVGLGVGAVVVVLGAGPAWACGALLGRNGTVNVVRTTTLAAYHDGVEHYVTSFRFAGAGGAFGSIVPLPGVPTKIEQGGDWTLQRLVQEVTPAPAFESAGDVRTLAAAPARVLLETQVDALDLTVLEGGAEGVGEWASQNGFNLSPDAPEVLDFYARRSPIFLAARFNADAAVKRDVAIGEGTPVHLTIPTPNPWVPLRILALGRLPGERVDADVFLLTDGRAALLPGDDAPGLAVERQGPASDALLADLRSDKGMEWVPASMQLTHIRIDAAPRELSYDLAVDASGAGRPSSVAAGLPLNGDGGLGGSAARGDGGGLDPAAVVGVTLGLLALVTVTVVVVARRAAPAPPAG